MTDKDAVAAARGVAARLPHNGGIRDDGHWHAEHCPGAPAFSCQCADIEIVITGLIADSEVAEQRGREAVKRELREETGYRSVLDEVVFYD